MISRELPLVAAPTRGPEWLAAARKTRMLSWLSLAWMGAEGAIAITAGVLAGSIALIGFGIDSFIEALASLVIVWRFTGSRLHSHHAEARAQKRGHTELARTGLLRRLLTRPEARAGSSDPGRYTVHPVPGVDGDRLTARVAELAARALDAFADAAAARAIKDLGRELPHRLVDLASERVRRCIALLDVPDEVA